MNKEKLLKHLENDIFCRVMPSKIAGVGVFAIKPIPVGANPFRERETEYMPINEEEMSNIDPRVKNYIKKLFVFSDKHYWLPEQGIQTFCITHFLNHSKNPNLTTSKDADEFFATRDIREGEELTVDYDIFDELKEDFRNT